MKLAAVTVAAALIFCGQFGLAASSHGDRSAIYMSCLNICVNQNCTKDGSLFKNPVAAQEQDIWCQLLGWSCQEECKYHCMWHTVRQFEIYGEKIPKFHGKLSAISLAVIIRFVVCPCLVFEWPFIRVLGMQEPASVFASVLNLAANYHMYKKIRREFPLSQPYTMPLTMFWHGFALVCMNAWVWSTIFHMRDSPFTEFMDYACALSMVMGLFVAAIVRLLYKHTKLTACVLAVPLFYFVTHVHYLYSGLVNYDYNMRLNVFFGVTGSVIWLCLSYWQFRSGRQYAWRIAAFTVLSGVTLSLELLDFPPQYQAWDAHALWHLSTAPLPLLFHQYVIEDLRYLHSDELHKSDVKLT